MGVYIKGMERPIACLACDFCNPFTEEPYCRRLMKVTPKTTTLSDCPIIEVPEPHGDLIDASEKIRVQMYDDEHEDFHTVEMTIDDLLSQSWVKAYAFPVIPASEEE